MLEELLRAAVCTVQCTSDRGTGFLVAPNRIITCRHCVEKAIDSRTGITVSFPGTADHPELLTSATVVDESEGLDICVLSLDDKTDRPVVAFADSLPREGNDWLSFGFPIGSVHAAHRLNGHVSSVLHTPVARNDIQLALAQESHLDNYRGVSGAPLIVDGRCSGVMRLKANGSLWAISSSVIRQILVANGIIFPERAASDFAPEPRAERQEFEQQFEEFLCNLQTGTIFLEGSHGIGKTTFCAGFTPRSTNLLSLGCYSVRIPGVNTSTSFRAQPDTLFDWLLTNISLEITGKAERLQTKSYSDTVKSTESLLKQFSDYCTSKEKMGVFFVDGIDEVARLGDSALSQFVGVFPLHMPKGVICVMTAPSFANVRFALSGRVNPHHVLTLPKLDQPSAAVFCSESLNHVHSRPNSFVDRICERADGHPLYLQYLIRYANDNPADVQLDAFPVFDGSIEQYYERIWDTLQSDERAVHILAVVARLREGLSTSDLGRMLTDSEQQYFTTSLNRILHLLADRNTASMYHASFQEFVITKTEMIDDLIYKRLADSCISQKALVYCRVNQIYHFVKAQESHREVAFQECDQKWIDDCFFAGVAPEVVETDLRDAVLLALRSGVVAASIRLLLLAQRLDFRHNTLFLGSASLLAEALVSINRPKDAVTHLLRYGNLIVHPWDALEIAWKLRSKSHIQEALKIVDAVDRLCRDSYGREMELGSSLELVYLHSTVALFRRMSNDDQMQYYASIQHNGIQQIRESIGDEDAPWVEWELLRLANTSNNHFFSLLDTYVPDELLREKEACDSFLMQKNISLAIGHIAMSERFGLPVPRESGNQFLADVHRLIESGERVDDDLVEEFLEALIRLGASHELAAKVLNDRELSSPKSSSLRDANGVDAACASYYRDRKNFLLTAFLNAETPAAAIRSEPADWLDSLEKLFDTVLWFNGRLRRAVVDKDAVALDTLRHFLSNELLPTVSISLADRIAWERSYAIPEETLPFLFQELVGTLAELLPDELPVFLQWLLDRCRDQCGMYTEGYRATLHAVVSQVSMYQLSDDAENLALQTLEVLKEHYITAVENRHEMVPGLLRVVSLYSGLGAVEAAETVMQCVLDHSMGPSWYKEDQFDLIATALQILPTAGSLGSSFARSAGLLERASGEMTFQRYVRSTKSTILGIMTSHKCVRAATSYFQTQSHGDLDRLMSELTLCAVDTPDASHPSRFPGGRIDEQEAVLELVANGKYLGWHVRWGLLEVFCFGDSRYLTEFATAFATLLNEITSDERALNAARARFEMLVWSEVSSGTRARFVATFLKSLTSPVREQFSELANPIETRVKDSTEDDSGVESLASGAPPDVHDEGVERDEFVQPGLFGEQLALDRADKAAELAVKEFNRQNTNAGIEKLVSALREIQRGGWSIWKGHASSTARNVEALLAKHIDTASHLFERYHSLVAEESHAQYWNICNRILKVAQPLLDSTLCESIAEIVLDHVAFMVVDSGPHISHFTEVLRYPSGAQWDNDLFEFILRLTDHPAWMRREKAAEVALWLTSLNRDFINGAASQAFGGVLPQLKMESGSGRVSTT